MIFCGFEIFETREKIPDSRVVAYDDNFKSLDNVKNNLIKF
jgi:hypothetical protein